MGLNASPFHVFTLQLAATQEELYREIRDSTDGVLGLHVGYPAPPTARRKEGVVIWLYVAQMPTKHTA